MRLAVNRLDMKSDSKNLCYIINLREPLSILIKYKTIDTPKIESILKNLFRRFD